LGTGRKLLLADDSITIQKVVNLTFADEGLDVTTVGNGDLAIEKIEEIEPDIVLADIHMPGLNGYEVCEFVKRNPKFRHIPVMLLVGSFEPFNEAEARRVGADDYLTKPFQSIRQLVSKVAALLSGKPTDDETPTKELALHQDMQGEGVAQSVEGPANGAMQPDSELASGAVTLDGGDIDAFADPSLDDAMIETTPLGEHELDITAGDMARGTTPMSTADLEMANAGLLHTSTTVAHELGEGTSEPARAIASPQNSASGTATADGLLDLGEDEVQVADHAGEESILDIWDIPSPVASSSVSVDENPVVAYDGEMTETLAPDAETVGADVVDVAPVVDVTPLPESQSQAVVSEMPAAAVESPISHGGMITLDQISPEVIDAIARRAVEQLSEKVVEQIAWEVVPELAERLIKRRLEEDRSQ